MVVGLCLAVLAGSPGAAFDQEDRPRAQARLARFAGKLQPCRVQPLEEELLCGESMPQVDEAQIGQATGNSVRQGPDSPIVVHVTSRGAQAFG